MLAFHNNHNHVIKFYGLLCRLAVRAWVGDTVGHTLSIYSFISMHTDTLSLGGATRRTRFVSTTRNFGDLLITVRVLVALFAICLYVLIGSLPITGIASAIDLLSKTAST